MNNKKFKVGDKVRITNASSIEPYELNKIGVIVDVKNCDEEDWTSYVVDMGRPRREREPTCTCWYLREKSIELVGRKNQQLLFNFMYEE